MKNNNKSFTMIELLLALSIFAVIASGVYSIFWSGLKLSHRAQLKTSVYKEARLAINLMTRELENMLYYDFGEKYPNKASFFGTESSISFLTESDEGLKAVSYYLVSPSDGTAHTVIIGDIYKKNVAFEIKDEKLERLNFLVREEKLFVDYLNNAEGQSGSLEVVSANVKEGGLKFSYGYSAGGDNTSIVRKGTWKGKYIPSDVRMEIDFINRLDPKRSMNIKRGVLISTGFLGEEEGPQ
ncbi:MAG: prepilin-type N-terminal cleavage/methylation domain-containing protein [Candidatus Omnitrophica bacterium]|nr:prepilin-type N-terminal cleavage/methylation domain-containing protein [Candidatus Omnitrophota bacterium]